MDVESVHLGEGKRESQSVQLGELASSDHQRAEGEIWMHQDKQVLFWAKSCECYLVGQVKWGDLCACVFEFVKTFIEVVYVDRVFVNSKNEPNWFQPVFYFELFHSI